MDEFGHKIISNLTVEGRRLSRVRSTDGFLLRPDTQQHLLKLGLLLLPIETSIEWRVRYELEDKHSGQKVCYITTSDLCPLPDIEHEIIDCGSFSVTDLLPFYDPKVLMSEGVSYNYLDYLFNQKYTYKLGEKETLTVLHDADAYLKNNLQVLIGQLRDIKLDWNDPNTIINISSVLVNIIRNGKYDDVEDVLNGINLDFQNYLSSRYFTLATSSYMKKPKMVNRVLPYLNHIHNRTEKIALIVIDGMTYWQYLVLEKELREKGIGTTDDMIMAWLPSITKLSRQALFRGNTPMKQYVQSPAEESKLWTEYWEKRGFPLYDIKYTHGSLMADDYTCHRQAFVDVDLDHKMHSSSNNKDLYDLTLNWSKDAANDIRTLHEHGYQIYITTDHGNVFAHGWRQLSSEEKTFLYEKESRGSRHLIYDSEKPLLHFLECNRDIKEMLVTRDEWTVWYAPYCFKSSDEITHGGAHFLELAIPFVRIDKE